MEKKKKKNNERKSNILIVLLLLLVISIGFSALTANLSIIGNTSISRNSWDVHFANVQLSSGSVSSTAPVLNATANEVTYSVTLSNPGDYYEFTVDAVNAGSIDAMIDSFSNTGLTTAQQKYLQYTVTYNDGGAFANKQYLKHGVTEKYKVRVSYKTDIDPADLPETNQTITLTFSVNYVQADGTAINRS